MPVGCPGPFLYPGGHMRKPIALLALLLSACALFAAHPFQLGAFISYQEGRISGALDSPMQSGIELRANTHWFSFVLPINTNTYNKGNPALLAPEDREPTRWVIRLLPSLNLNVEAGEYIDIALGAGVEFDVIRDDADGNRTTLQDFGDLRLFYRAALSANIGGLGLSIAAEFPVKGTFSSFNALPDFHHTRVRLSGLLNFY